MREFLEDAHEHRDDGYGRAQKHVRQQLPKRFYTLVDVAPVESGFGVTLDGKSPRTPGMKIVSVPSAAVAEAMAVEWRAQGEFIDPMTMPLTRIVNSAVEAGDDSMAALREEIVKYAGSDMLIYRADGPEGLVQRQDEIWGGLLDEMSRRFDIVFRPTTGIVHQEQPAASLERLRSLVDGEGLFELTALNAITSITGSGLLAVAHRHGLADRERVWAAAHVDEDHNVALWGEVEEITARRAKRRKEFDAAVDLLEMLNAKS